MRNPALLSILTLALVPLFAQTGQPVHGGDGVKLPAPPQAEARPVTDKYYGTKLVDNYRWLEDAKSDETRNFIDEENKFTEQYFNQARIRPHVQEQLDALMHVGVVGMPVQRGENYFFLKRLADEDQASIYLRRSWTGKDERLLDPGKFSKDPNTSINISDISRDGQLIAFNIREGGADEVVVRIYDVKNAKTLEDELPSALYNSILFSPDGKQLYYCRNSQKGTLLYQHTIGRRNSTDELIFGHEFHGEPLGPIDMFSASITDDARYMIIHISRGIPARREDVVFRDLRKPGSPFDILVWGLDALFNANYAGGKWMVHTNYKAPKWRILEGDPGILPDVWTSLVPEGEDVIDAASIVGGHLYLRRLHNVLPQVDEYTLTGHYIRQLNFGGIGSISSLAGRTIDRYGFISFQSFIQPPTIYRIDSTTGKQELFWQSKIHFDTDQYELKQVIYTSKDGTKVPMFIAGKKGLKQDGSERMLMTGYGGFDLSMTPAWNPMYAWWLEQGGWFALPNLRGGGEFGEEWHKQGMFEHKQNVFDDWFAAAEYLIANHYTSQQNFAITGRSNGGLLMGASMTQRPELFSAIACGYPLLDMLRYQKFLQGIHWTTEYGSADNEDQFSYLLKYSPYQNVKPGAKYPAIYFFTGDSDTRVDPLHARKMTALMQSATASGKPVLLRYSLKGGHSSGVSVEQAIEDYTDILTFLWTETEQLSHK